MNIAIAGCGYVGLVTGVCLAEAGHHVACIDIDRQKVIQLKKGSPPMYEPGLKELLNRNLEQGRIHFHTNGATAYPRADVLMIAVGTPQQADGQADLQYVFQAAKEMGTKAKTGAILVVKSTVPVGTGDQIDQLIHQELGRKEPLPIASNPEFLREGSAISDTLRGDRLVIGAETKIVLDQLEEMYADFHLPVVRTDRKSAEMIKYASNAFLATKISFMNEIASICEKTGADVEWVAQGMGLDQRIGSSFLRAGIGYGGSCFPKDTNALVQIAGHVSHDFELLKAVIKVNNEQRSGFIRSIQDRLGANLEGKKIALLGLSFKPNTDDMREAPSVPIAHALHQLGAKLVAYDPVATRHAARKLPDQVLFAQTIEEAIKGADAVCILTEWADIQSFPLSAYQDFMRQPIIFDGRNCHTLEAAALAEVEYHSIGRRPVSPIYM
ncbi:UDP-glucose/GDP-mannose dehydrogenase family protein [Bacillus pumilus]|uniref:UDP-glucose dehydrogenase family protein n=1 Tax=Bacillus pumilus TaxID=1408 RepID=UPI0011E97BC5|nr:UDP-glucose/GDP-mannose dehydrogenase family protein [Bacillus pumilus]TYS33145.1 UDP-glucose/GDP-mannose dehydrogenase family protein [Bacillus pumilus]TYS50848.1 UDP-glucose/GDP-mannose dehydrogenase family protein [Bacillus pumilus]